MPEISIQRLHSSEAVTKCAEMMAHTDPWLRLGRDYETCHRAIADPTRDVFVAIVANDIAGFVIVNMTGAFVGYIQTVCVAERLRGQGIGASLIRFAEGYIFERTPNVFMCVSSFNPNALRLYQRLGYHVIGELKDYLIPGASEILLRKTIGPLIDWSPKAG